MPSVISPSTTLVETPAACARPLRVQEKPSEAVSSTRARAGVIRSGSPPTSFNPSTIGSGSKAFGALSAMRATSPGGESV
ncbi:hypothetical protein ACVMIX_004775 [Rhizobium leguminosarum]